MAASDQELVLTLNLSLDVQNGGLFVSRGFGIHPDRRINSHELIFVREGVLGIAEDGVDFRVRAGEALILWPSRRHYGTLPYEADLAMYWIHFTCRQGGADLGHLVRAPQHTLVARPDHLTWLMRRFLEDQEAGALDGVSASLLVLQMLCEVGRAQAPCSVPSQRPPLALASRADVVIRTRYSQPLTSALLADELACNPNYLNIVYRRAYGRTLTEAIHGARLRAARRLLTDGDGNIDEIARFCGFTDPGYFRRLFKRAEGMSPNAYRRLYARVHAITL